MDSDKSYTNMTKPKKSLVTFNDILIGFLILITYFYIWYTDYKKTMKRIEDTDFPTGVELELLVQEFKEYEENQAKKQMFNLFGSTNEILKPSDPPIKIDANITSQGILLCFFVALGTIAMHMFIKLTDVLTTNIPNPTIEVGQKIYMRSDFAKHLFIDILKGVIPIAIGIKVCMSINEFYHEAFMIHEKVYVKEYVKTQITILYIINLIIMFGMYILYVTLMSLGIKFG